MRQSGIFSRQTTPPARHLSVGERVATFLRSLHPDKTAANVAADTRGRLSARTIEKLLERRSAPSLPTWIVLIEAYGPELMCAVMERPPAWLTEAGRAARRAALQSKIDALRAELEEAQP